jgi:hypothetical protein
MIAFLALLPLLAGVQAVPRGNIVNRNNFSPRAEVFQGEASFYDVTDAADGGGMFACEPYRK